jgi:Cu+-exporting ATPase
MTHEQAVTPRAAVPGIVHDPVCGMSVDAARSPHKVEHAGHTYHFCGDRCRERFIADPPLYLTPAITTEPQPIGGAGQWTCPMHPEIVRSGPGSCPICGMALEPIAPTAAEAANPELADMTRRFWIGVALSLPLVALAMTEHFRALLPGGAAVWLQLVLATPVVLWCGLPFFERGWASLVHRHLNMFTLIHARHRHRLRVQPDCGAAAGAFSGVVPDAGWDRAGLFRTGGGHRNPGVARPSS